VTVRSKKASQFPHGWDKDRVQRVIAVYDRQSDDEVAAEVERAFRKPGYAMLAVPVELLERVRGLVAKREAAKRVRHDVHGRTKRIAGR
jgi:hypothetical protein